LEGNDVGKYASLATCVESHTPSEEPMAKVKTITCLRHWSGTVVYADGSIAVDGGKVVDAGAGLFWFQVDAGDIVPGSEMVGQCRLDIGKYAPTSARAEILAAAAAVHVIGRDGFEPALIRTDSQYVIGVFTEWMRKWAVPASPTSRVWRKSPSSYADDVANSDMLGVVVEELAGYRVELPRWQHVRGHVGEWGNEIVDAVASASIRESVVAVGDGIVEWPASDVSAWCAHGLTMRDAETRLRTWADLVGEHNNRRSS
jgi:ribonuclease HI